MPYRFLKYFFAIFIAVYFIGGLYTRNTRAGEAYPFYSWFLFDQVPNEKNDFTIRIVSYGGKTYNPPLEFSETREIFQTINQSATQYLYIVQDLGYAIIGQKQEQILTDRERLEKIFLGTPARYEVLQVRYDPVQYWKTGEYKELKVIATYESGK
jgi:hypothetical protein